MGRVSSLRGALLVAAALGLACGDSGVEDGTAADDVKSQGELAVGVAELSGLALRTHGGRPELLAVGDASYTVVVGSLNGDDVEATTFTAVDLEGVVDAVSPNGSQWESVASDASGRVFVLEESPGHILVFDAELETLEHSLELRVERTEMDDALDAVAKSWAKEENSRGEGFALLTNGHVLVLKEKQDRALLEFGPEADAAVGFSASLAVGSEGTYPVPSTNTLVLLHAWELGKAGKLPDLSDLALDASGRLFVISGEGATVARLPRSFTPDDGELDLDDVVKLPGKADSAEALVFLTDGRALVGCDFDKKKNTFLLAP